jgi:hypothetical protein
MTDKAIPSLPAASALTGSELIHVVQGGNSRKVALNKIADTFDSGWAVYADAATALEANAISLTAGQRTLITIDAGAGSITDYVGGSGILWQSNAHTGASIGDSWTWRLRLRAKKTGGATSYLLVEQDNGTTLEPNVIGSVESAIRSDNQAQTFTYLFAGYTSQRAVDNGFKFYVTASANCQIWAKNMFIRKDYHPQA